jgi:hypothetical protein
LHGAITWYTCSLNSTHLGRRILASSKSKIAESCSPFG